jgi:hypothetical protein
MKGSCLCKAVSFDISGTVHNGRYCHCSNCRKFSGTAYAAWGLVPTEQFSVTPSEGGVTKYDSGGGLRAFCSTCVATWFEPAVFRNTAAFRSASSTMATCRRR